MTSIPDPLTCKESFLQENGMFSEIKATDVSKPIGKLDEFDLMENEIWLLQCPKNMDVSELNNKKLKIPGRTNINNSEAVAMEFNDGNQQHAFAYRNRKGRYALRLLPVRGTIILRDQLKTARIVSETNVEECCPNVKKTQMPANIRIRHPLLGVQYEEKLKLDKSIVDRLHEADKLSAQMLQESFAQKTKRNLGKTDNVNSPIEVNSTDDSDAIEFVSEKKLKKKRKHKHSDNKSNVHDRSKKKKFDVNAEDVSKELQWLKNISF